MKGVVNGGNGKEEIKEEEEEEEEGGMSVHSPCKAPPPPSSSSLRKEQSQVEVELRLLEAIEVYPLPKLRGVHRHFVLYGLTEYLRRSFGRQFSPSDVLQLLDHFYNLEMLKPEDTACESEELVNRRLKQYLVNPISID